DRAGLKDCENLSVIADGDKWIWDQARQRLSKRAEWCVDVYPAGQHLHECAKLLLGESPAARTWAQQHLDHLLEHAGVSLIQRLQRECAAWTEPARQRAMERLLNYLNDN